MSSAYREETCPICKKPCTVFWDAQYGHEVMCNECALCWTEFPAQGLFLYRVLGREEMGMVRANSEEDAVRMLGYSLKEVGITDVEVQVVQLKDRSTSGGVLSVFDKAQQQTLQAAVKYFEETGFALPVPKYPPCGRVYKL